MTNEHYYKNYFTVSHKDISARNRAWKVLAGYLQKRFMPANGTILDLGAGYGTFINNITAKEKYALDRGGILQKYAAPDVETLIQSCTDLKNLQDNYFDVVFASNLLEHLTPEETEKTLKETMRILKPSGKIILLQPNFTYAFKNYFDDFTHIQIFTHLGLRDLLTASGFTVRHVYPKFMPYSLRSKLPAHPLLVKLYLRSPWKPSAGQMLVVAEKQQD